MRTLWHAWAKVNVISLQAVENYVYDCFIFTCLNILEVLKCTWLLAWTAVIK